MIENIRIWYKNLSKRVRDSFTYSIAFVGFASTVLSIFGFSLKDLGFGIKAGTLIVIASYVVIASAIYFILGRMYKDTIELTVRRTPVSITSGDIFGTEGLKVIGCDSHFDTRIDDRVISKTSLHGLMFLHHGKIQDIQAVVAAEAQRLNLEPDDKGQYDFPLGTIIRYDSSVDGQTYLLLAMTELDNDFEAHTDMAQFEHMLMKMWKEIDRVYAKHDIVIPLLGDGITRFDDAPKGKNELLRCILCTLNGSGVTFKSNVKIVLYKKPEEQNSQKARRSDRREEVQLYEYKDLF